MIFKEADFIRNPPKLDAQPSLSFPSSASAAAAASASMINHHREMVKQLKRNEMLRYFDLTPEAFQEKQRKKEKSISDAERKRLQYFFS